MSTKFQGWLGHDPKSAEGNLQWGEFEPKRWEEDDVDIEVICCGVCGTDAHILRSDWGPSDYPCCPGHEIVGRAIRVGSNVTTIRPGDRVGVGPYARTCNQPDCHECTTGQVNYCPRAVLTYNSSFPNGAGKSYGGYSLRHRAHASFVFRIPDGLPSAHAAPMLCAGITLFSPLKRYATPDASKKSVGIVGIGGLGHFGILFAKALGVGEVVALSRSESKRADALALGAGRYISTADEGWAARNERSLDVILMTGSSAEPITPYLLALKTGGTFVQLAGPPEGGNLAGFNGLPLIFRGLSVVGALAGTPDEVREMLQLAADKGVQPWVQTMPMRDANRALVDLEAGKPRFRLVLVNEGVAEDV